MKQDTDFFQSDEQSPDSLFATYRRELEKLNLSTPADLEKLVTPLVKDATRIILKKSSAATQNVQLISHFGGLPYFETGETWPKSRNGNYMDFVCQIVNTGNIHLPDEIALVQFYYDFELDPWDTGDDGWLVKIYPKIDKNKLIRIENPLPESQVGYCEMEFSPIKSLPDWQGIDLYQETASKLSCVLNEDDPWEPYQATVSKLCGEYSIHSQIGGYPIWMQGESTPKTRLGGNMQLLFQIDSEEEAGLMWGDGGLIYIFYDPGDLTRFEFVLHSL